jgi:cell wall-associated NlpC family hydrolase
MRYVISTLFTAVFLFTVYSFGIKEKAQPKQAIPAATRSEIKKADPVVVKPAAFDNKGRTAPDAQHFVDYAKSLIGTPYAYGSVNPSVGFDCSGFVNYVSNHFGIKVPRSSVQFTDLGKEVEQGDALPGDIILFTGTNPTNRVVGHMGIVTENPTTGLMFIHSSSGKRNGVTISEMSDYYKTRFVKIIRIFPSGENLS